MDVDPAGTVRRAVPTVVEGLAAAGFEDAQQVGRGAFGLVYRCRQVALDRTVAVKVLTATLTDDRARFVREQRAMGQLTGHPNIVAVLNVGELDGGLPYLVMPYYAHGSVQERIARLGLLPLDEVLRLGVKTAGALSSAHRLEIVHRDVKPANILLTDYGEPALCDFGIARMRDEFKTATGLFAGSPAFMAPEVIGGDAPSAASDVYGLGASLFAALTGHAPFARRAGEQVVAQLLRITTESIPDMREEGVSDDVAEIVRAAMARDPTQRPSPLELGELIKRAQACHGLPVDEMALHDADWSHRRAGGSPAPARPVPARRLRGNLPAPVGGLVGRGAELAQVAALVKTSRLVTVTGIGGVGKTTLATHVARTLGSEFPDGVWLVELADLSDDSLLTDFVTGALGIRNQSNRPLLEVLLDVLAPQQVLVVLDNCEHVVDAVAKLVAVLLPQCPRVHILATSREMLDLEGESVLALSPLTCPEIGEHPTIRSLAGYEAVALFVARAGAAVPGFALTEHNAAAVADICRRLDGLPLAIGLAAARLRAMSASQIAAALSDRYALLSRGRRRAPHRQQTLAACIGWSYDLCTQAEQGLWARLSVFATSFDLPAAHQVCGDDLDADQCLDLLCALVDKSILVRTEHHDTMRFRLLETLRDYGRQRMADSPDCMPLRHRHAVYYQRLVATATADWFSARQVEWVNRLTHEMPNLREALQFSLLHEPVTALQMAGDLRPVWVYHGILGEGDRWLDLALSTAAPEPSVERIVALSARAQVSSAQSDFESAAAWIGEAQKLLAVVDDPRARGLVNYVHGTLGLLSGDAERAIDHCQRALNATNDVEVQVDASVIMGWLVLVSGDVADAMGWFDKALARAETCGDSVLRSHALASAGVGRWLLGESGTGEYMLRRGLAVCQPISDSWSGAQMLEILAWIAASNHEAQRATVLMAAAAAVSRADGADLPWFATVGNFHGECERAAREQLSQAEFDVAWNQGRQRPREWWTSDLACFTLCDQRVMLNAR